MIKKLLLLILLPVGLWLLPAIVPGSALAFDVNNPAGGAPSVCSQSAAQNTAYCNETAKNSDNISGVDGIILKAVDIISIIAGVAAVIMIIIGAISFILSGGDSNRVAQARNMVIYALIGLVVIAVAQPIVRYIIDRV